MNGHDAIPLHRQSLIFSHPYRFLPDGGQDKGEEAKRQPPLIELESRGKGEFGELGVR